VNVTNRSVGSSQDDNGHGMSGNNSSTREHHVDLILLDSSDVLDCAGVFTNTFRLAGQDTLVDAEAVALNGQDPAVCRNAVSDSDLNNITRNQVICLDSGNLTTADNLGFVCRVFL